MDIDFSLLAASLLGSTLQEVIHLNEIKHKLSNEEIAVLLRSMIYWLISFAVVVLSGVGAYIWAIHKYHDFSVVEYMIFGAAFPILFKKAVKMLADNEGRPNLGQLSKRDILLKYFAG